MSKQRYTIETLASGQPRPYADSIHQVRVTFESDNWRDKDSPLAPSPVQESFARYQLAKLPCGFVGKKRSETTWPETYLEYLRPVDGVPASEVIPGGDPKVIVSSVWEFQTVSPFTD